MGENNWFEAKFIQAQIQIPGDADLCHWRRWVVLHVPVDLRWWITTLIDRLRKSMELLGGTQRASVFSSLLENELKRTVVPAYKWWGRTAINDWLKSLPPDESRFDPHLIWGHVGPIVGIGPRCALVRGRTHEDAPTWRYWIQVFDPYHAATLLGHRDKRIWLKERFLACEETDRDTALASLPDEPMLIAEAARVVLAAEALPCRSPEEMLNPW